jgi:hypothetical protein
MEKISIHLFMFCAADIQKDVPTQPAQLVGIRFCVSALFGNFSQIGEQLLEMPC